MYMDHILAIYGYIWPIYGPYLVIIFYDFGRGLAADLIFSCVRARPGTGGGGVGGRAGRRAGGTAGGASLAHMKKLHWGSMIGLVATIYGRIWTIYGPYLTLFGLIWPYLTLFDLT